jgi:hypothetical protein
LVLISTLNFKHELKRKRKSFTRDISSIKKEGEREKKKEKIPTEGGRDDLEK